jgi:hypothetical protein
MAATTTVTTGLGATALVMVTSAIMKVPTFSIVNSNTGQGSGSSFVSGRQTTGLIVVSHETVETTMDQLFRAKDRCRPVRPRPYAV